MYKKNFLKNMILSKKVISESKDKDAGLYWLNVKEVLVKGNCSSYKKSGSLCELTIQGYSDEYISNLFNISESTLRVNKRILSNDLYKLFGNDFFDLLQDYKSNEKELLKRLHIVRNLDICPESLFPSELLVKVKSRKYTPISSVDIKECKNEISFLLKHSIQQIDNDLNELDISKVNYLLEVLSNSKGSFSDRYNFLKLFNREENNEEI